MSDMDKKSRYLNLSGNIDNFIYDLIDEWHVSNSDLPVYEYLNMSKQEYFDWLETPYKKRISEQFDSE